MTVGTVLFRSFCHAHPVTPGEAKHLAPSITTCLERRGILRPFARTQNDTGLRRVLNDRARRNRASVTPQGETSESVKALIRPVETRVPVRIATAFYVVTF